MDHHPVVHRRRPYVWRAYLHLRRDAISRGPLRPHPGQTPRLRVRILGRSQPHDHQAQTARSERHGRTRAGGGMDRLDLQLGGGLPQGGYRILHDAFLVGGDCAVVLGVGGVPAHPAQGEAQADRATAGGRSRSVPQHRPIRVPRGPPRIPDGPVLPMHQVGGDPALGWDRVLLLDGPHVRHGGPGPAGHPGPQPYRCHLPGGDLPQQAEEDGGPRGPRGGVLRCAHVVLLLGLRHCPGGPAHGPGVGAGAHGAYGGPGPGRQGPAQAADLPDRP
mmetsp:Transcript_36790/g.88484  ORF Transcript_36790/g.88484 Transcript_36790/m.88484 type:complete len:275 (+) Transcript_36790:569-1393(+)